MTLDIIIATLGEEGIRRVEGIVLPVHPLIRYVVGWQNDGDTEIPESLRREDIQVIQHATRGLSLNRNVAIEHAQGDICLIMDDDETFTLGQMLNVIRCFEERKYADIILFRFTGNEASPKYYPKKEYVLKEKPAKFHYVNEIEIAFRRCSVQGKVRFNELMGLGAPVVHCGEGEAFIFTALRKGLTCVFVPIDIASHPQDSTYLKKIEDKGILMGTGVMIYLYNPQDWWMRMPVVAYRLHRNKKRPFLRGLYELYLGQKYCKAHFTSLGEVKLN